MKLTGTYSLSSLNEKFDSNALEISEAFIQSNSFSRELYFSWLIWSASNSENSLFMILTQFESLFLSINLSFLKIFELKDFQNLLLLLRNHFLKNEDPIMMIFLSFMVLFTKNTGSKSDSLFSKFRGLLVVSLLFFIDNKLK